MRKILIVVATQLEAARLPQLPGAEVVISGIGAVNAALATQRALLRSKDFKLVLSVGIAGAYPNSGLGIGQVCVSNKIVFAGLGALDGSQFLDLEALGLPLIQQGHESIFNTLDACSVAGIFAESVQARLGAILTLETVTGSFDQACVLEARIPGALAEGMEGAGVALAATQLGVPILEIRGISNAVGPRDRAEWHIMEALEALSIALRDGWNIFKSLS